MAPSTGNCGRVLQGRLRAELFEEVEEEEKRTHRREEKDEASKREESSGEAAPRAIKQANGEKLAPTGSAPCLHTMASPILCPQLDNVRLVPLPQCTLPPLPPSAKRHQGYRLCRFNLGTLAKPAEKVKRLFPRSTSTNPSLAARLRQ